MENVIVVIGAGSIGQAIVRRVATGKHVLLAGIRQENADSAANCGGGPKNSMAKKSFFPTAPIHSFPSLTPETCTPRLGR